MQPHVLPYEPAPDGQPFLIVNRLESAPLNVIVNWRQG
jgi:hypothetical protein